VPAVRIAAGFPLYRLWMEFDPDVAAEQLLGTVAAWIDAGAAERLRAAGGSSAEIGLADGGAVIAHRFDAHGDWVWHASWPRPYGHGEDGRLELRAVVCARGSERHVGLEVSVVRTGAALAPTPALGFRAPELPALLLDTHPVSDAQWPLRAHALELRDRGDAEELAAFLYCEERRRPVVHCSARRRGPSLDAHRLARELAGLAHVTSSNDGRIDDALKAQLPGRQGVWGGAVRVYYPGLANDVEHRYISAEEINRHGEGRIRGRLLRDLAQLACATMAEPATIAEVRSRALAAHAPGPSPDGRDSADAVGEREPGVPLSELLDEHERTLRELEHTRGENDRLQRELEEGRRLTEQQARQIADLSHRAGAHWGPGTTNASSNGHGHRNQHDMDDAAPRTAVEAVTLAMRDAKHLAYASRAVESAKDCPYQRPEQILDALRRLDQLAEGYLNPNGIGCGLDERARQLGLRWQGGLHDSIIARHPNHYTITYQDRRFTLGPHVALGGGDGGDRLARIYLVAHPGDQETERALIVGHVGRHLPDSSTG
jgi:hypothetical protein